MLSSIIWEPNPEIIRIGSFAIRWYGVLFALGFVISYQMFLKFFRMEKIPVEELDILTMYMVVGTVVGARLGHCLFYEANYFLSHPMEILYVWKGGLASHGAAIGILLAIWVFSKKYQRPWLWVMDRIVMAVALTGICIRLGNLMNSEIYGYATNLPWGMIFARNGETIAKHPTQIYESLWCLIVLLVLYRMYMKKQGKTNNGVLFALFMIMLFVFRFCIEYIKEPQEAFEQDMLLNMGQLLSIPFIIAGIALYIYAKKHPIVLSELPGRAAKFSPKLGRKAK